MDSPWHGPAHEGHGSPSASFEKQKCGKTDHFITFIHFNITKYSKKGSFQSADWLRQRCRYGKIRHLVTG